MPSDTTKRCSGGGKWIKWRHDGTRMVPHCTCCDATFTVAHNEPIGRAPSHQAVINPTPEGTN